jgi:hypothetical protein
MWTVARSCGCEAPSPTSRRYPLRLAFQDRLAATVVVGLVGLVAISGAAAASGDTQLPPNGTLLHPPREARTVTLAPNTGCQTLLRVGTGDGGVVNAAGGGLIFTVEAGPPHHDGLVSRPWTVTIYRASPSVPNGWQVALATAAHGGDPASMYANVTARTADLTGDGHQSLLVGYRAEGTGEILDMDIDIGTPKGPRLAGHRESDAGGIQILPGRFVATCRFTALATGTAAHRPLSGTRSATESGGLSS